MTATTVRGIDPAVADRKIAVWLLVVAALVFAMVLVGGATRLTESGLSIVDWRPVTGTLPPLSDQAWAAEFSKYQQSPQYQKVNRGMTVDEFKTIFWWEYGHRLMGRIIGFAFLVPLLFFMVRGYVRPELRGRLFGLFVLGGLQGALGWFMVASGLVDRPSVSHYRLAAHFSLALIIYAALIWVALGLLNHGRSVADKATRGMTHALTTLVGIQIVLGAFVAGLDAGYGYNTWPLMDGRFVPTGLGILEPWWINFFENHTTVQFEHRMVAYAITGVAVLLWWRLRQHPDRAMRHAGAGILAFVLLQMLLGILTLIHVVPVSLGVAHQGGALLIVTILTIFLHRIRTSSKV